MSRSFPPVFLFYGTVPKYPKYYLLSISLYFPRPLKNLRTPGRVFHFKLCKEYRVYKGLLQSTAKSALDKTRIMRYTVIVHFSLPRSRSVAARLFFMRIFFVVCLILLCKQLQRFGDIHGVIDESLEKVL